MATAALVALLLAFTSRAAAYSVLNDRPASKPVTAIALKVDNESFKKVVLGGGNEEACPWTDSGCNSGGTFCGPVHLAVWNRKIDISQVYKYGVRSPDDSAWIAENNKLYRNYPYYKDGATETFMRQFKAIPTNTLKTGVGAPDDIIALPAGAYAYASRDANDTAWYYCWNPPCRGDNINADGTRGTPQGQEPSQKCPTLVVYPPCAAPELNATRVSKICGTCAARFGTTLTDWGRTPTVTKEVWGKDYNDCNNRICRDWQRIYTIKQKIPERNQTYDWGTATAAIKTQWKASNCDYDCSVTGFASCGDCALRWKIPIDLSAANRWAGVPPTVKAAWAATYCDRARDGRRRACIELEQKYGIVPGKSWGSATDAVKKTYQTGC